MKVMHCIWRTQMKTMTVRSHLSQLWCNAIDHSHVYSPGHDLVSLRHVLLYQAKLAHPAKMQLPLAHCFLQVYLQPLCRCMSDHQQACLALVAG